MREEQERADDRRDDAREMIKLNRLGKWAVRCEFLVWQLFGRCQMRLSTLLKETLIERMAGYESFQRAEP